MPFDREALLLWIVLGLIAASIGRRALWTVIVDWLPLALVLIAYDYLRGLSDTLGMPTWWTPQLDVDKFLFGGTVPTIWLQEHFKYATAGWWDVTVSLTYVSFFVLPYLTAAVFWLRSRAEFRRWAGRFVSLSFLGFGLFALIPAAPPWAAAKCSAAEVADHPSNPICMRFNPVFVRHGGLLGPMTHPRPGARPYLERISGRGWPKLHLGIAQSLLDKGQGTVFFFFGKGGGEGPQCLGDYENRGGGGGPFEGGGRRRGSPPTASRMENPCPPIATTPSSAWASAGVSSSRPARSTAAPGRRGTTARSASSSRRTSGGSGGGRWSPAATTSSASTRR